MKRLSIEIININFILINALGIFFNKEVLNNFFGMDYKKMSIKSK
jgi:hypothetical protein